MSNSFTFCQLRMEAKPPSGFRIFDADLLFEVFFAVNRHSILDFGLKTPRANPPTEASQQPGDTKSAEFGVGAPAANAQPDLDPQSGIQNLKSNADYSKKRSKRRSASKIQNGKRPYVKTPARVAAARANLEKARAAPKEKVYRRTEKRLAANRANLEKARQVPKEIRNRHTAKREAAARAALGAACEARQCRREAGVDPNIHHGHTCRDPRQALRMLGRQREEYEAHRALWQQALPAGDELQRTLVEGIAQAAWRRLQLYRSQASSRRWRSRRGCRWG